MDTATAPMTADASARFADLLDAHRGILFKVAHGYARTPHEREDLVQDIAVQAWRAFPGYDAERPFSTWLYRVALNVAISQLRSRGHRERHLVSFDEQAHDLADERAGDAAGDPRLATLERFLAACAPLDRALLLLYLDGHGHRDIAEVLGLSETNVATRIGRLKQRIRAGHDA